MLLGTAQRMIIVTQGNVLGIHKRTSVQNGKFFECSRYGNSYIQGKCPAFYRICNRCKLIGNFRQFWKSKRIVHEAQELPENDHDYESDFAVLTDSKMIIGVDHKFECRI